MPVGHLYPFETEIMTGPDMEVVLEREGTRWTGKIIAVSDGPAVLFEQSNGKRIMVARDGCKVIVPVADDAE